MVFSGLARIALCSAADWAESLRKRLRQALQIPTLVLCALVLCPAATADVVHLKSGGKVEGKVTERKEDVLLVTATGSTITIPKDQIARIEYKELPPQKKPAPKKPKPTETNPPDQPEKPPAPLLGEPIFDPFIAFRLRFPYGWRRLSEPSGGALVTFIGLREAGYPPKIDLLVVESASGLDAFASELEHSYSSVTANYKGSGVVTLPNNTARISGSFGLNESTVFHADVIFHRDNVYFILSLKCNDKSQGRHTPGFDAAANSFEFTAAAKLSDEDRARFKEDHDRGMEALRAENEDDKAVEALRAAAEVLPGHPDVHRALAHLYTKQNKLDLAAKELKAFVELFPDSAECHFNLGTHMYKLNRYEDAADSLKKATELNPNFVKAHVNLGVIYRFKGQVQEAIRSLKRAIEIEPSSVTAHFNLGQVYIQKNDLKAAKQEFERVLEIDPEHHGALTALEELNKVPPQK